MAISLTIMSIDFDSFEPPVTKTFNQNEISIGRKEGNDLVLDRSEVSAYHAKISLKKNGADNKLHLFVKDLGSSSGTMVERDPLEPDTEVKINSNQRLIIGSYLIKPNIIEDQNTLKVFDPLSEPELLGIDQLSVNAKTENLIISTEKNDSSGYFKPTSSEEQIKETALIEPAAETSTNLSEQIEVSAVNSVKEPEPLSETIYTQVNSPVAQSNNGIQEILPKTTNNFVSSPITEEKSWKSDHFHQAISSTMETTPAQAKIVLENSNILDINFTALQLINLKGRVLYKDLGLDRVLVDAGSIGKVYTDENGFFKFENIEEGTSYQIILNKEGYTFESSALSGIVEMPTELEARAIKLFNISGKVVHQGKGFAGVLVNIPGIGATTTMNDGSFKFSNIKEGTAYKLTASKDKFVFDDLGATKTIDRDLDFTINAKQLFNIGGKIIHKGKPIAGVEIECINVGKTTTDSNGNYSFENVPEGQEYVIKANKPGFIFKQTRVH